MSISRPLKPHGKVEQTSISSIKAHLSKKHQREHRFKCEWAVYQARQQVSDGKTIEMTTEPNGEPTIFGLMQQIWFCPGQFDHGNLANIFLKQTAGLRYGNYKQSLMGYLWFGLEKYLGLDPLREKFSTTLDKLFIEQDGQLVDSTLRLRTCNRLLDILTTQGQNFPSSMFTLLAVQQQYDVLGILLLKIMLISRPSYRHFSEVITTLQNYYEKLDNKKSQWLVHFLEGFKINLTLYFDKEFNNVVALEPHKIP